LNDYTQFKADIQHIVNRIDKQMATVTDSHAKALWAIFSLNFHPILNLFVNLVQYIISPIIDISTHRNSLFTAPDPKIVEDLRNAVSEIPEVSLN